MLRRTPLAISSGSFNAARLTALQHFSKTHSTDIPVEQARPTFNDPKSPAGSYMSIDTSFSDVLEVGQDMPVPDDIQNTLRELAGLSRHDQVRKITRNKMKSKILLLQTRQEERQKLLSSSSTSSKNDVDGRGKKKKSSSSSSQLTKQQQQEIASLEKEELELLTRLQNEIAKQDAERVQNSQESALSHFQHRSSLAKSIRKMAEDFNTKKHMSDAQYLAGPNRDLKGLNSGPKYEMRNVELARRRSWFALRHAFLTAAPILFGSDSSLKEVLNILKNDNNNNADENALLLTEISEQATQSMSLCCDVLTWMKLAADMSAGWSRPISWDNRPASDFDQIDFATLATHLLQQYSNVLEFSALVTKNKNNNNNQSGTTTTKLPSLASTMSGLVSLLHLCGQYNVDKALLQNTLSKKAIENILEQNEKNYQQYYNSQNNNSKYALNKHDAKEKLLRDNKPISSMNAVALGLVCDEDLLQINNNNNNNGTEEEDGDSLVSRLFNIILQEGGGATLNILTGSDLTYVMEFLLRVKKANPEYDHLLQGKDISSVTSAVQSSKDSNNNHAPSIRSDFRLFNNVLVAAQRRMRILMHHQRSTATNLSELNSTDTMSEDALFPLKKFMEYQKTNNPKFTVLEFKDLKGSHVEGLTPKRVDSKSVVSFFKLLLDISTPTATTTSGVVSFDQQQQQESQSSEDNNTMTNMAGTSLICSAWMNDVVRRAAIFSYGTSNSISLGESLSLLQTVAMAAPQLYSDPTSPSFTTPSLSSSNTFLRAMAIIQKTISDHALELSSKELVDIFRAFVALKPVVERMADMMIQSQEKLGVVDPMSIFEFPTCMDALEMRLLKSNSHSSSSIHRNKNTTINHHHHQEEEGTSPIQNNKNKKKQRKFEYRLSLSQQTEISKCLVQLLVSNGESTTTRSQNSIVAPRLVLELFVGNSAKILERLESLIRSSSSTPSNNELISSSIKNGSELALSLVSLSSSSSLVKKNTNERRFLTTTTKRENEDENDNLEVQLTVLLDNLMRIVVTPPPRFTSSLNSKNKSPQPVFNVKNFSEQDKFATLQSLLQILGKVPHTRENLPIVAPCQKICQEIISSIATTPQHYFSSSTTEQLLTSCRGLSKMIKSLNHLVVSASNDNNNKHKHNFYNLLLNKTVDFASNLYSQLAASSSSCSSLNFLELAEVWEMLQSLTIVVASRSEFQNTSPVNSSNIQTHIEAISSQLSSALEECSDLLKNVILARNSGGVLRPSEEEEELVVSSLDFLPMSKVCENIVMILRSHQSSSSSSLEKAALRFLVCSYGYQHQEMKMLSLLSQQQDQENGGRLSKNQSSNTSMIRRPRRLGFESSQIASNYISDSQSAMRQEQKKELQELGRIVRNSLNVLKTQEGQSSSSETLEVINEEWQKFEISQ